MAHCIVQIPEIIKYSQFCYNACFENMNLFQCNWDIWEQFKHNANFTFASVGIPLPETLGELKKLHPAEPICIRICKIQTSPISNIHQLPQFTMCAVSHIWRYKFHLILRIHLLPSHSNLKVAILILLNFEIRKLQVFLKIVFYCRIYVLINHLMYIKLCYHIY